MIAFIRVRTSKPGFAGVVLGSLAALTVTAIPALASGRLDATFVERLVPPAPRRHPLADASGRLSLFVELPRPSEASSIGARAIGPTLGTLRLSPSELGAFAAAHPNVPFFVSPPFHPVLDESARLNGTLAYRAALGAAGSNIAGTGQGVVVGIVDSGLDVGHLDFRDDAGHSRVAWMIDFSHPPIGTHADLEASFGCSVPTQASCAVLDRIDIDSALAGDAGTVLPRDRLGHGTHVASIAAGNGGGGGARFVGGAPAATLVIANVAHGPGGDSSDVDIATAVAFVFDRARFLGLPAVVNLSLGSDYGPHDGTTPVERALASMVGADQPGRAIVVAAGNSGVLYGRDRPEQRFGIHTQSRVTAGVESRAPLQAFTTDGSDKVSGSVHIWLSYGARDDVSIGLEGPRGLSIPPLPLHAQGRGTTSDNLLRAAIYNGVSDPEGALTPATRGAIVIWDGEWSAGDTMIVRQEGEGFVDAWVDARPDGLAAGFAEFFGLATRQGTITVPATHPDLISVGCTVNRTQWTDRDRLDHDTAGSAQWGLLSPVDSTCFFGSAGPTAAGVRKPEISAPGAMIAAAMSSDVIPGRGQPSLFDAPPGACPEGNACLVVDDTHALMTGSSMSAPQVTGAVALLFERNRMLTQPEVRRLLEQGARRPGGAVGADYVLGVGALDVVGAMAALEGRSAGIGREPDAAASWMSLSDGYARPDPGFAIEGAVEVRATDGSIADGFESGRLALAVSDEGVVTKPLAREAAGLWGFEVRALPEMGGRSLGIEVRLDGKVIGEGETRLSGKRGVGIGGDRWIALGTARAYGGCAIRGGAEVGWSWVIPALLALSIRRRR